MTAVHPIPSGDCIHEHRHPSPANINDFNKELTATVDGRYHDLKFADEEFADADVLLKSFSPLLQAMKLFGMYIEPEENIGSHMEGCQKPSLTTINNLEQHESNVSAADRSCQEKKNRIRRKVSEIYAVTILSLLWINFFRFLTAFNGRDSFDERLTGKLVNLFWFLLCAINQSSLFIACYSGRLHRILSETRVTKELAGQLRKRAVMNTAIALIFYFINVVFFLYYFFLSGDSFYDYVLAPSETLIPINNAVTKYAGRAAFCVVGTYILSSLMLPPVFYNTLANLFSGQFLVLDDRLKKSIGADGRFTGSIGIFRRRHHMICRDVKYADYFVSISNLAALGFHGASQILIVYAKIFQTVDKVNLEFVMILWIVINGMHLLVAIINGVIVNVAVSYS
jgi:hypothetical protein